MKSKKATANHIPNIKYIFIIPVSPPPAAAGWPGTKNSSIKSSESILYSYIDPSNIQYQYMSFVHFVAYWLSDSLHVHDSFEANSNQEETEDIFDVNMSLTMHSHGSKPPPAPGLPPAPSIIYEQKFEKNVFF